MAALEAALGDVVERHESLRTIFPDTLGVPRQQILDAVAARPRLEIVSGRARLALPRRSPLRRGAASILPASLRCGRICLCLASASMCCCWLLHHIAGDGWSLAPLWRDLARAYAARRQGKAPALRAAAGAVCRLHAVAAPGAGRGERPGQRHGAAACVLDRDAQGPARSDRAADRSAAPCGGELSRRPSCLLQLDAGSAPRAGGAGARQPGEPVHGAAGRRLRRCSPGWAPAPTFRSAARSPDAPTARSTIWSASSSTPWCCAPTRRAIRASAS